MKIVPILIILYIALIGIMIFDGILAPSWTPTPYGPVDPDQESLWRLFIDPTGWTANDFINLLIAELIVVGAAIAVAVLTKSDIALLSPLFIVLINAGILPILAIYNVVNREVWRMACTGTLNRVVDFASCSAESQTAAWLISAVIVGPISLAWVWACIEWWTQRPTS